MTGKSNLHSSVNLLRKCSIKYNFMLIRLDNWTIQHYKNPYDIQNQLLRSTSKMNNFPRFFPMFPLNLRAYWLQSHVIQPKERLANRFSR